MAYGDVNPNHQSPFTYKDYVDRGWANSGIPYCECAQEHKETHSNGYYAHRGTDEIVICHNCKSFIHIDMSD